MKFVDAYPARTLSAAAKDSYWRRYKDLKVHFFLNGNYGQVYVEYNPKRLRASSVILCKQLLRHFGDIFQCLDVPYPDPTVSQYVNKYTSNTLMELTLQYGIDNALDIFKKPYKELEYLALTVQQGRLETGNVTLAQAFPKLKLCKMDLIGYNGDGGFFVGHLPYLKSMELYTSSQKYIEYRELIQSNPQIQSLKMNELTQDFGREISDNLLNLECLEVSKINIVNEISFKNVKRLEIRQFANESMEYLSFPRLEILKVKCVENYKSELFSTGISIWAEFIKRHPNVTYEI